MNRPSVRVTSPTERVDPRTTRIDETPTLEVVRMMNTDFCVTGQTRVVVVAELETAVRPQLGLG